MDKPSERKRDSKREGDTDVGVQDYKAGGKRAQLDGLWSIAPPEVVGLPETRVLTNCYCKETGEKGKGEGAKPDLMEEIVTNGPPLLNVSKPNRVL